MRAPRAGLAALCAIWLLCWAVSGVQSRQIAEPEPAGAAALGALVFGSAGGAEPDHEAQPRLFKQEVPAEGQQAAGEQKEAAGEDKTIAQMLDEKLKEEFKGEEEKQLGAGKQYNETVASSEGTRETVVIISSGKKKGTNATATAAAAGDAAAGGATHTDAAHGDAAMGGAAAGLPTGGGGGGGGGGVSEAAAAHAAYETASVAADEEAKVQAKHDKQKELEEQIEAASEADVDRIIDSKDNEYVLSKPSDSEALGINLDPQFVRDLTVLIAASAAAGVLMGCLGQPAINGYFLAGSLVGPGGFKLIKEIVQVQSVAQLGVHLLLFTLGLEFSLTKLRAVRNVALFGGLLQTALFAALAGLGAKVIGTNAAQGAFVGALVAMSSTSIVVKVLSDCRTQHSQPGQITIGTLVLQDCLVGLLFAFMPVLATAAGGSNEYDLVLLLSVMARVVAKLAVLAVGALVLARTVLPPAWRWLARRFGPESFQLASIAFCLLCALTTARQGVSAELGAFAAGVMLSATEQQEAVLHHLEPVAQFFLALFVSSTGLVLSPVFLFNHLPLLACGAVAVIVAKTLLIAGVVAMFRYPADTALAVGINLSQIGEFVFVLLSVASQQELIDQHVYLLLMGVTALTLLVTPFLLQVSNRLTPRPKGWNGTGPGPGDLELSNGGPQSRADLQRLLGGLEREGFEYHGARIPMGFAAAPAPSPGGSNGAGAGGGGAPQVKVLRSPPPGEGASEWEAWKRGPPGGLGGGKDGVAANGGVPRGLTTATLRSSSSSDAGSLGGH